MDVLGIAGAVFTGLVLGSFATALSYRIPRHISLLTRSHCPACRHPLGVPDLVPLFSWIFLKGKCRHCSAAIPRRYPFIEFATLALCLIFYSVYGLQPETILIFALAPVLVSLIDIDLHYKILPDGLNLAIFFIGLGAFGMHAWMTSSAAGFLFTTGLSAAGGMAVYGCGSLLLRQAALFALKREALGLGDIKFFAAAGFWLGLNADRAALFLIVSGGCGMAMAFIWKKWRGEREVPFGPSLILAFIAALSLYPPDFILPN